MKMSQTYLLNQLTFVRYHRWLWLCLFILPSLQTAQAQTAKYKAIIDAGSSGSRIYLYHISNQNNGLPNKIDQLFSHKVEPGLSSLVETPKKALKQLEELLGLAKMYLIPRLTSTKNKIELHLMATAGMRLVTPDQQQQLMQQITTHFSDDPIFDFKTALVLSGRYEGLYSWLAANYLSNRLKETSSSEVVIELGGASMQISKEQAANYSTVERTIPGHKKPVVIGAHSFLGLGQDQASQLIFRKNKSFLNKNTSFAKAKEKIDEILKARCQAAERIRKQKAGLLTTKLATYQILTKYIKSPVVPQNTQILKVLGLAKKPAFYDKNLMWTKVIKQMRKLSDEIKTLETDIMALARAEASLCLSWKTSFNNSKHKILAVAAFYYTLNFFELLDKDGKFTLKALAKKGTEIYNKGWASFKATNPKNKYLKTYYFNLAYIHYLFEKLFDFKGNNVPLYALSKIKDAQTSSLVEPTWTLGAVIDLELGNKPEKH